MTLIPQEELDTICPPLTDEINRFVEGYPDLEGKEEAVVYALAQSMHENIGKINATEIEKGAIISTLIRGLIEFNAETLAIYREQMLLMHEGRSSTRH